MGWQEDARCRISSKVAEDTQALLEELLNPETLGRKCRCRVIKHPNCCARCRANNDCNAIPMHAKCRCTKEYECF